MAINDHVRRGHPILFGLIVFFSIITGAIATWLTAKYNQHHDAIPSNSVRDRARFLTFTSWWTVVFTTIFLVLFLHSATGSILTSVGAHGVYLFITWVLWTAGAASITAALGGGNNCSNIDFNLPYCNQLNALMGFSWVVWVFVTIALIVVIIRAISATRRGDGLRGHLVA